MCDFANNSELTLFDLLFYYRIWFSGGLIGVELMNVIGTQ